MSTSNFVVPNLKKLSNEESVRQVRLGFLMNFNVENVLSHMYVLPNIDDIRRAKRRRLGNRCWESNLRNSDPLTDLLWRNKSAYRSQSSSCSSDRVPSLTEINFFFKEVIIRRYTTCG